MAKVMSGYENIASVLLDKTAKIMDVLKPILHLFREPEVGLSDKGCVYQVLLNSCAGNLGHKTVETLLKAARDNGGELDFFTTENRGSIALYARITKLVGPV